MPHSELFFSAGLLMHLYRLTSMTETTVCVSPEIDYEDVPCLYGSYQHIQVTSQEALVQVTPTSGQTLTFQILGSNVCNLSKSYLEFIVTTTTPGAGFYTWLMAGAIPFFRSVAFQPVGGQQLYIDMYHHYSKMSLPYLISAEELKTLDNSNMFFPSRTIQSANKTPADGFNAAVPYDEFQYAINIDGGTANSASQWLVRIPFKLFAGTILAEDRDFCFGQAVNIQFTVEDPTRWIWKGTSSTNPVTGAVATTGTLNFTNLYLQLAVEQDETIRNKTIKMYESGYSCYVPSVQKIYQQQITGASQNINAPVINRGYGEKLQRIFVSPFYQAETINTSLDNANQTASPVANVSTNRVITFQTLLDSRPRQQYYISAAPSVQGYLNSASTLATTGSLGDWSRYYQFQEGSSNLCSGTLGLNWCFVDDWTSPQSRSKKYNCAISHKIEGLDLTFGDHTWQFLSTNANNPYNWYVYIQTLRKMEVGPGYLRIF